jgi:hypothetical protein
MAEDRDTLAFYTQGQAELAQTLHASGSAVGRLEAVKILPPPG